MKKIILIKLLLITVTLSAQELFYKSYDWDSNPVYTINGDEKEKDIVLVKEKTVNEFSFEDEMFTEYYLIHKVYWLNSDEQIERYNKMYLPNFYEAKILENKARVITPTGEVINLDKSKINKATNEETGEDLLYYAFEGIVKGSFIESYYLVKKFPKYDGKRVFIQSAEFKRNVEFDVFAPKNLIFDFKSFNNSPEIIRDTLLKEKEHWSLVAENVKSLEREDSSPYHALRSYVVYKADKNLSNGVTGITSYKKTAKNIHKLYYEDFTKKEIKLLAKLLAEIKETNTNEDVVMQIDTYIKTSIYSPKMYDEKLFDLENIITKKVANLRGLIKLYVALLRTAEIKHEIVLTSDRTEIVFDKKFEADCFTTNFLIYINSTKKYLSPSESSSRYGFPPTEYTDNYGLFIKQVKLGDFKSAIGKVKYIKSVTTDKNEDKMTIDVSFDKEDISIANIKLLRSLGGYNGLPIQSFIHLIKDKDELIESFAKQLDENATINTKVLENDNLESVGVKPLILKVDFDSEAFVNKAGENYLFSLGDLIGTQMEMYQDKKRQLPYYDDFKRIYYRTIKVALPEGYIVSNLDDINIDNSFSKDGKKVFLFKSSYTIEGSMLIIQADEYYKENLIALEDFEAYRKVINSAADFNKITLVLKPKATD